MWDWIKEIETCRNEGREAALVTVCENTGSTPREVGAKMLVFPDGSFRGTIGGGNLEALAIQDGQKAIKENKSQKIRYPLGAKTGQCCGGIVELLFEVLNTQPKLYLFGAGHVGQAVCRTLAETPFSVHVIDEREEWVQSERLPKEIIRHCCEWQNFVEEASWDDKNTYVAIMTHRHDTDQEIVEALVHKPTRYLGLIGSQSKWKRFQQRLHARGVSEALLNKVQCPLGVPLGGKSPQEIAISLSAQLLQIFHGSDPATVVSQ
jgi:xanthine dehydrogenase accessory factor